METSLASISRNHAHYKRCYDIFEQKSGKIELYNKWASEEFPNIIQNIFDNKTRISCGRSLGIGSGTGSFEAALLKQLQLYFPSIHHIVVEPSETYVSHYKLHSILDDVQYDWQLKTMQQFKHDRDVSCNGRKFDFISAVNSLYYADDLNETLRYLVDQLTPKGCLMIFIRSEKGAGYRIIVNFPELHPAFEGSYLISSQTIVDMLTGMGLKHKVYHLPTSVDFSSAMNESDAEGNALLDLYTGIVDFRQTAPPSLVESVLEFLNKEERPDEEDLNMHVQSHLVLMEWDIIFIEKQ
ncbi:histamine N-methyltransferase A-like [Strongylocentrotus purpuratus]|uniref:Histamine N-methyltransferase n=1 Tax=Strongylocentrotus purpuratus TaxID=7668 RepID=A0A7M7PFN6_STRPU|nr:histamine N-methyltransferase A-like [Strongylocentrotus purpuratus]